MVNKCSHDNCVEGRKLLYIRIHFLSLEMEFLGHLTLLPVALLCRKVLSAAHCNGVRLLSDVFKSIDSTSMKSVLTAI